MAGAVLSREDANRQPSYFLLSKKSTIIISTIIVSLSKIKAMQNGSTPFPWRLHALLNHVENTERASIVSWLPNGLGFRVHKPDQFTLHIMPLFFNQSKYRSFQRQLNIYSFQRITSGPDRGAYFHEFFVRFKESLFHRMVRVKIKGTGKSSSASSSTNKQSSPGARHPLSSIPRYVQPHQEDLVLWPSSNGLWQRDLSSLPSLEKVTTVPPTYPPVPLFGNSMSFSEEPRAFQTDQTMTHNSGCYLFLPKCAG
jgi:hypothetical protein